MSKQTRAAFAKHLAQKATQKTPRHMFAGVFMDLGMFPLPTARKLWTAARRRQRYVRSRAA